MDLRDFAKLSSELLLTLGTNPPGSSSLVWNVLLQWSKNTFIRAGQVWPPVMEARVRCEGAVGSPCAASAVARCAVCGAPCCLSHAWVHQTAEVVCDSCVVEVAHRIRTAELPPEPDPVPRRPKKKKTAPQRAAPPPPRASGGAPDPLSGLSPRVRGAYQTLGVTPRSTDEEIKRAYRELAVRYHPDRNPDDRTATQELQVINAALQTVVAHRMPKEANQ